MFGKPSRLKLFTLFGLRKSCICGIALRMEKFGEARLDAHECATNFNFVISLSNFGNETADTHDDRKIFWRGNKFSYFILGD
ncbi:hypothetical protein ACROYT_G007206 [Oculina patagonica]